MKLLLTAFDPFGGERVNPALEAIRLVPDEVAGWEIAKLEVPTVFGASVDTVAQAIRREKPDAVLCIGQAGGRCDLTPERVAINISDARIADNAGKQPIDEPIAKDGPAAYFATLPVKAMAAAIREAGLPASVSNTAGTFVCNHLMYGVLHLLAREYPGVRGGFMHVPFAPEQVTNRPAPSMSLRDIARGIEAAIGAIARNGADIASIKGTTH
ncbi:MAG: pyroglutamyl-peptidase I [Clostridia bacterium]|nr:pyroglutamyl-peptidase I [Clostridia bacterium]